MAASNIRLPTEADNTGKYNRTWQRTVGATAVEEHFYHKAHGETAVVTSQAISATNVTLKALNQQRLGLVIFNDGDLELLYVKLGATATVTDYTYVIPPKGIWTLPVPYAGIVDALWSGTTGTAAGGGTPAAKITEITP